MRRRLKLGLAAIASGLVVALSPATALGADLLPDLGFGRPADFTIEKTPDGRRLLRYLNLLVNVGRGPIELRGARSSTSQAEMTVTQWIYSDSGAPRGPCPRPRPCTSPATVTFTGMFGISSVPTSSALTTASRWGQAPSTASVWRRTSATGSPSRVLPSPRLYHVDPICGGPSDLSVTMGLSVGWGDLYHDHLPDQYIEVTGLGNGRYRFQVTADAGGWFTESNELNNATWVDLQLKPHAGVVKILAYGQRLEAVALLRRDRRPLGPRASRSPPSGGA